MTGTSVAAEQEHASSTLDVFKRQIEAVVTERNLDTFFSYIAPDCIFRDIAEPASRHGHAEIHEYMTVFLETLEDFDTKYVSLFGDGDYVAAEFEVRVTYRGKGAAPEGTRVTIHYCIVDEIRDGLVQRETVYWDPQEVQRQLSGTPGDGGAA